MRYKEYYKQFKRYWPYIREIDDCLALWLEKSVPEHLHFTWDPKDEHTVEVTLFFYKSPTELRTETMIVPVDELVPLDI